MHLHLQHISIMTPGGILKQQAYFQGVLNMSNQHYLLFKLFWFCLSSSLLPLALCYLCKLVIFAMHPKLEKKKN